MPGRDAASGGRSRTTSGPKRASARVRSSRVLPCEAAAQPGWDASLTTIPRETRCRDRRVRSTLTVVTGSDPRRGPGEMVKSSTSVSPNHLGRDWGDREQRPSEYAVRPRGGQLAAKSRSDGREEHGHVLGRLARLVPADVPVARVDISVTGGDNGPLQVGSSYS